MQDAVLDGIQLAFARATAGWYETIFPFARKLFFALAIIELVWAAALWVLERDDPTSVVAGFLKKIVATSFFYATLLHAGPWTAAILNSFSGIGAAAAGMNELTPSGVLSQGIDIAAQMLEPLGVLGFVSATIAAIIGGLSALGVIFAYGIIAAQLLLTNVESYIVIGGGTLLLAFSGSRWTIDLSSRYLSYAVSIGIKLFCLYLIIGIGNSLAGQWGALLASPDSTLNPRVYFQVLGGALSYMMLAWYIPSLASSLYAGTIALSVAELAYASRGVGSAGGSASAAIAGSAGAATDGSRAVFEAASYGQMLAAENGGGLRGALTGSLGGAAVLAREGMRSAIPTLASHRGGVSHRIAEARAIRRPADAGYGSPVASDRPRSSASEESPMARYKRTTSGSPAKGRGDSL